MLNERQLYNIHYLFIDIRLHAWREDAEGLAQDHECMKQQKNLVGFLAEGTQRELFLYCFAILFELIDELNYQKIAYFSDAVHNLPEALWKHFDLKQYWITYIESLNTKYNQDFFKQFELFFKESPYKEKSKSQIKYEMKKAKKDDRKLYK